MKTLMLFIWLLSTCSIAVAADSVLPSYSAVGKEGVINTYPGERGKELCEKTEGQDCFEVQGKVIGNYDVVTTQVDDMSKPIYKPNYKIEACDSPQDCQSKQDSKDPGYCEAGDYLKHEKNSLMPGYKYFCTGISSYEKKDEKTLVVNEQKKQVYDASEELKSAEAAVLAGYQKDVSFGVRMIGMIALRNRAKNLTTTQKKSLISDFRAVMDLLGAGAIPDAKAEIETIAVQDPIVTQADKDALLAEINSYLGN